MSTQIGDMEELTVALFVFVVKIVITMYFGAFILEALVKAGQGAAPFLWAKAAVKGAVSGLTGVNL